MKLPPGINAVCPCRGQASLEVMLIMAALAGVLIAFSPAIGKTALLADYTMKERQMNFEIEKVFGVLMEVSALGGISHIEEEAYFPVDVGFSLNGNLIVAEYEILGKRKKIEREIGNIVVKNGKINAGKCKFVVEGAGKGVNLRFETTYN
jgi:hypothetical protein